MLTAQLRTAGSSFSFYVLEYHLGWADVGGVYAFARLSTWGDWHPFYVGKTESFRARMAGHTKWNPALALGATNVLALSVADAATRAALEAELIAFYNPPLNEQQPALTGLFSLGRRP
ncbi:MAG: GIY-YIG nuclease family protein, partial [Burkholderiales bacterium]